MNRPQRQSPARPVAIVTGAAGGIGSAAAIRLARTGHDLTITDINAEGLSATEQACRSHGAQLLPILADQRSSQSVSEMATGTVQAFGRIDVLVNIAGVRSPGKPIADLTDTDWGTVLQTNLSGVFYLCRAVIPVMTAQQSGSIISISSGAAFRGLKGGAPYAAAKAGLVAFHRVLALEVAPYIRVNVVAPGPIEVGKLPPHVDTRSLLSGIPLGHFGQPDDVAQCIAFLAANEQSAFITGQVIHVNGGSYMP